MTKNNAWPDQDQQHLSTLWATGLSCLLIAKEINRLCGEVRYTRNAVIGKATRMRLPSRVKSRARVASSTTPWRKAKGFAPPKFKAVPMAVINEAIPDKLITLADRPDDMCRWPFTVNEKQLFGCTCKRVLGQSYCAGHMARATNAAPPRRVADNRKGWPAQTIRTVTFSEFEDA